MTVASNLVVHSGPLSHAVPTTTGLAVLVRGGDDGTLVIKLDGGRFLFISLDDLDEAEITGRCVLVRRTCSFDDIASDLRHMPYAVDHTPMVEDMASCQLILIGLEDEHMDALIDVGEVLWDSATSTP